MKFDPHTTTTDRTFDAAQVKAQIGRMNILAISGGRTMTLATGVLMASGSGYYVSVHLEDNDTYTVRRLFKRSGEYTVKGVMTGVYADQLSDVAYEAGCHRHEWAN